MRRAIYSTVFALIAAVFPCGVFGADGSELPIAQPPMSYYAPAPTFHDHIIRRLGVMVAYVVGSQYTQAIIYDSRRKEWQLIVSGTFKMEGRTLRCEKAPEDTSTPANIMCPDWPDDIVLYTTPVIFTYWMTRLGDEQIAVLQSVDVAKPWQHGKGEKVQVPDQP